MPLSALIAKESLLFVDSTEGEAYVLAPPDCNWELVQQAFEDAFDLGYLEVDFDSEGPDEPEVLEDGSLRFWLYNPTQYMDSLDGGPLWLS